MTDTYLTNIVEGVVIVSPTKIENDPKLSKEETGNIKFEKSFLIQNTIPSTISLSYTNNGMVYLKIGSYDSNTGQIQCKLPESLEVVINGKPLNMKVVFLRIDIVHAESRRGSMYPDKHHEVL
ncbi:hypothetical protein RF11_01293 [Thelohanellus kitauei]|uniref:Uncharacterized protein n=1 Tax=Thelohanellus kitauei TaxID=669202 RepID=A0A0C2M7I8_THEKT|nr:hypothetical protein RF11_01293 [Thelohanellus kitauei]